MRRALHFGGWPLFLVAGSSISIGTVTATCAFRELIESAVSDTQPMEDRENPPADSAAEQAASLEAYDLDGDGRVSNAEAARANLGVIDAGLQNLAKRGGIVGRLAAVAHRVLDRFDND